MDGWDGWRGQSRILERIAAASLGFAVAFAAWTFSESFGRSLQTSFAASAAVGAFAGALLFLDRFDGRRHAVAAAAIQPQLAPGALLVRLQDVLAEASAADAINELFLDDPLPAAQPDSRVVQLFQPSAMPTAGELQARIERHLDIREPPQAPADHSSELFEALATLKRSLG